MKEELMKYVLTNKLSFQKWLSVMGKGSFLETKTDLITRYAEYLENLEMLGV